LNETQNNIDMSVLQTNDHSEKLDLENHNLRIKLSEKTKENEEL
jgi:hypothetical protein